MGLTKALLEKLCKNGTYCFSLGQHAPQKQILMMKDKTLVFNLYLRWSTAFQCEILRLLTRLKQLFTTKIDQFVAQAVSCVVTVIVLKVMQVELAELQAP